MHTYRKLSAQYWRNETTSSFVAIRGKEAWLYIYITDDCLYKAFRAISVSRQVNCYASTHHSLSTYDNYCTGRNVCPPFLRTSLCLMQFLKSRTGAYYQMWPDWNEIEQTHAQPCWFHNNKASIGTIESIFSEGSVSIIYSIFFYQCRKRVHSVQTMLPEEEFGLYGASLG